MNAGLIVLLAIFAGAYAMPEKANGAECMMCKMMVQYVEQMAEDDEPTIEGAIDHMGCDHLGFLKQQCYAMVHQYLPKIIEGVEKGQPPNVVCGPHELRMCDREKAVVKREVAKPEAMPEKSNGAECMMCKMLVQYVEQMAEDDEPTIEGAIDHMGCDHLGFLKQMCYTMVHQYLPRIIEGVEKGQPPNVVCGPHELKMCPREKAIVKREVAKPKPKVAFNQMECMVCHLLVDYVEKTAEEDEPSIEHAIDSGVCKRFGQFDGMCEGLVHQYLPDIITYVGQGYPSDVVCKMVKMCK